LNQLKNNFKSEPNQTYGKAMMFQFLICVTLLSLVFGEIPSTTKVTNTLTTSFFSNAILQISAAVKDTSVNGVEGFNFNIVAPFKFQDYVVGFRYALGNFKKVPESVFARRTFETGNEGTATVNADYDFADNSLNLAAKWNSDSLGVTVEADGDTKRKLKTVGVSKNLSIKDNKLTVTGAYDLLKKKVKGSAFFDADGTTVNFKYDTEERDPLLEVSRALDDKNEITPSIRLRSGEISYGYKRKWHGGSLLSRYFPGDKVSFEWKDEGASGTWTTTADVPLADASATKVSFSREWNY
jgi:hypothetical protein